MTISQKRLFRQVFGVVLMLIGVALGAGRLWLAVLGGSLFYAFIGVGYVVSGLGACRT